MTGTRLVQIDTLIRVIQTSTKRLAPHSSSLVLETSVWTPTEVEELKAELKKLLSNE